jgi:histidinol-phosphate aminotransferase
MTQTFLDLTAPPVRGLHPYIPGKPVSELEREYGVSNIVKLASNENPLGAGPLARKAVQEAAADIGFYPDGGGFVLKSALARMHGVTTDRITLGNGSNDILVLLAEAFLTPDAEAVYSQYSFAVYPIAVQAAGAKARVAPALPDSNAMPLGHDLDAMAKLITPDTRLVFVANPNNPTGTWLDGASLRKFIQSVPQTAVVVLDEAYFEYSRGVDCPDGARWVEEFPNLVVVRTFSKAHGLAGLRIGYALSHPQIAEILNRLRQPFNVNSLGMAAAAAAVEDAAHVRRTVELNDAGVRMLTEGMRGLGLKVIPSAGNFVLADLGRPAGAVYESLLRRGVIARPVGNYGLPNHLRVSTGTAEQNQRFLAALAVTLEA